MQLTPDQARYVERAREVLAEETPATAKDMAIRVGALEWHLQEMLALISELAG